MKKSPQPAPWMKDGTTVDYHSVIGEPATVLGRKIIGEPWQLGHGAWVVKIEGVTGGVSIEAISQATAP